MRFHSRVPSKDHMSDPSLSSKNYVHKQESQRTNMADTSEKRKSALLQKERLEFDDVFKHNIKEFGCYQNVLYWMTFYLFIPLGLQFGLMVFVTGTPNFHCATVNVTCADGKCCDECTEYTFDGPFTSIVSEWNLICGRAKLGATSQAVFLVGMLLGSVISGIVSDYFGRRLCIFSSLLLMVLCTSISSAADCLSLFLLLRFGSGFSVAGVMLTQYVYVMELVGPSKRTLSGKVTDFGWVLGACVTAMLGYLIREWRVLLLVGSAPGLLFLFTFKFIPETARWLFAHDKLDDAHAVLMKCADKEHVKPDEVRKVLDDLQNDEQERAKIDVKKVSPLDMIKTPKLRKRTIILCYNWFVVSIVYFGFVLYVTSLSGNVYMNFFIMSVIDLVHTPIVWFLLQKFGRRISYFSIMMVGGVACILVLAVPKDYTAVVTTIAMIGKFCDTAAFSTIYLYTSELYPTVIRNIAMGTSSMCARLGGIIAPYIVMMAQLPGINLTLPIVIFGICTVSAGIASLWLPETLNSGMQQTIEEAEEAPEDYSIPFCGKPRAVEENDQEVNPDECESAM